MSAIDPEDPTAIDAVARARERLGASSVGDDVVRAVAPGPSDLVDARTAVSLVLTIAAFALVDLDGARSPSPSDPLDLALRMLAFTSLVRTCILVADGVRRYLALRRTRMQALVLLEDTLVVLGDSDVALPRTRLLGAAGGARRDGKPVVVITAASPDHPVIRLGFGADIPPDAVARRIERYVRETERSDRDEDVPTSSFPEPTRDPRAEFDRVVRSPRAEESVVSVGYDWLRHVPFAAPAFVVVFAERAAHVLTSSGADAIAWRDLSLGTPVLTLLATCTLVPLGWLALGLARVRAMGGAAMVLVPAELLVRSRAGIHRVPWRSVDSVDLAARRTFTMLGGSSVERALVVTRSDGSTLRFEESLLGEPVDVVRAMLEAYSDGAAVSRSQGAGGGGGISATDGTTT